jgi:alkylation response protein AidB-like acyl-CoA dehydrogenase
MRLIGCAQRALELMCKRAASRVAFGRALAEQGSVREDIAHSFCEIAQARLLTLQAADKMDREGNKAHDESFKFGPVDEDFARADHIVRRRLRWKRSGAQPIETCGCISGAALTTCMYAAAPANTSAITP